MSHYDGTKISINRKGMSAWLEIKQEEKLTQKTIKDPKLNAMAKLHLIAKSWTKHTMDKPIGYWSMFYPDLIRTFPRQNSMLLRRGTDSTFHRSLVEFQMLGNICRTSAATSSSQRMSGWMGNARRHTGLFQHHENHNWNSDETVEVWASKTWGTFWKQHSSTIGERALSKLKGATSK